VTPWWQLGEAVGDLPRLLLQAISFPERRRRVAAEEGEGEDPEPDPGEEGGPGTAVIIGGTSLADEIVLETIRQAGGRGARVAVVPGVTLDCTRSGERYARSFRRFGVTDVEILDLVTRERAAREELIRSLAAADLVFLGGGREALLLDILRTPPVQRALSQVYRRGGVVAGIGAGAAVLGAAVAVSRDREGVTWEEGLNLLPLALLDRERVQSGQAGSAFYALAAARKGRSPVAAVGVDDGTALIVERGRRAYVVGSGAAIVALPCEGNGTPPRLMLHVLPAGYAYDLAQGRRLAAPGDERLRTAR